MAVITMRQMLEAGVHFGHQTRRWNPKMKRFIFGERNGIYIIDLEQTLKRVESAYAYVRDLVAGGGTILFVGTKKQAQDPVRSYAEKCGMPYVNERWLGGMLTNFDTISKRVGKMIEYERMKASGEFDLMPKKEALLLTREMEKLQRNLGGLRGLTRKPDAIFVLDTKKEHIAVTEANKLTIPVVAVVDTNVDPELVQYPIPGNDDAIRANSLLARVIADAVEEGRYIANSRDPGSVPVVRSAEDEAAFSAEQSDARNAAARAQADRDARLAAARQIPPPPPPSSTTDAEPEIEPEIEAQPAIEVEAAQIETADVETGDIANAEVETSDVETGDVETGDVETGEVETADVETGDVESAADVVTPATPDTANGAGGSNVDGDPGDGAVVDGAAPSTVS